jgi:hypothetical protein
MSLDVRRTLAGTGLVLALFLAGLAAAQPPLEALPALLQLQPSQHPAWRAYKDAAALQKADAAHDAGDAAILNAMTTPERLDALRARLKAQEAAFDRQAAATEAFYAVLSPDQKRIFDQLTRAPEPRAPTMKTRAEGPYARPLRTPPADAGLPPPAR